jgi:hypothetical protein
MVEVNINPGEMFTQTMPGPWVRGQRVIGRIYKIGHYGSEYKAKLIKREKSSGKIILHWECVEKKGPGKYLTD